MGHIELARWADLVLIAPATANTLSKLAHGFADELLPALCLATTAPIVVVPAMNREMWLAAATQENRRMLHERGVEVLGPAEGEQACGETGPGRMLEPIEIIERLLPILGGAWLAGLSILVTAGPTFEAIDPVRFIGNHSTGKMGYAIAQAAAEAGARTTLISGPTALTPPSGASRIQVISAKQMYQEVMARAREHDIFIAAAAVADYRAADYSPEKIKKRADRWTLELVRTPDILSEVAALPDGPFTVGFAAETQDLERNALDKLRKKRVDLVAANWVGPGVGFGSDDNALSLYWEAGHTELGRAPKVQLARELLRMVAEHYHAKNTA